VATRSRRARNLIWLTPESLQAAERLSGLTGMPVPDLIELVLLELTEQEMSDAPPARSRPAAARPPSSRPGDVIPIGRARAARGRPAESAGPRSRTESLDDLHARCTQLRALAERARTASARAREHARAVLERRDGED
jgi:hypothetical protein